MSYSGKFKPKNTHKYIGNVNKIYFRSLWERQVMRWCDDNPKVVEWESEETVIPYLCETDQRIHRYFMDFFIKFSTGEMLLVEVKPKRQTQAPKRPKRQTKRFLSESLTFVKNNSKWKAARQYASKNNMKFAIWTEDTLKQLGIKIESPRKPRNRRKPRKT